MSDLASVENGQGPEGGDVVSSEPLENGDLRDHNGGDLEYVEDEKNIPRDDGAESKERERETMMLRAEIAQLRAEVESKLTEKAAPKKRAVSTKPSVKKKRKTKEDAAAMERRLMEDPFLVPRRVVYDDPMPMPRPVMPDPRRYYDDRRMMVDPRMRADMYYPMYK